MVVIKLLESEDDKIRSKRAHKLFLEIIENILLIDLLISEHYLLKLQVDMGFDIDPTSVIGTPNLKGPGYPFGDKAIKNKLEELRRFSFYPTQELRSFVSRSFLTVEQVTRKRESARQWVAILIAFLVGFASHVLPVGGVKNAEFKQERYTDQVDVIDCKGQDKDSIAHSSPTRDSI